MYFITSKASRIRQREAQNARDNRAEIRKALTNGQISRRDLYKWGLVSAGGLLAMKNGLNPMVRSAFAAVPTGTPRSPLFGARAFKFPMVRLDLQKPTPMSRQHKSGDDPKNDLAVFSNSSELPARRLSYHTDFTNQTDPTKRQYNPLTGRGPIEGRPPGEVFAHQRWDEFFPEQGYVMSWGQAVDGLKFHPDLAPQDKNSVWTYGTGRFSRGTGPFLIKGRYGEPMITRIYNNTPVNRADNNGFGRNESQLHHHNAHNGAESDGAANVHHFPGTFYDYRWSTTMARRDKINTQATDPRCSGPDGNGGLVNVPGDWREIQSTLWAHDHRFFFTAENVYKGNLGMVNYYSGKQRGNDTLNDGINLRLPSGSLLDWGNIDFDVNLIVSDAAFDPFGQLYFDIFDTDGFLGDLPLVNLQYKPFMDVLPRKYRFRLLSAGMSRFIQLQLADSRGNAVPFTFISNDGNLVVNPFQLTSLPQQGTAERYDIVVDFSKFKIGDTVNLVNTLLQTDGRKPDQQLSLGAALGGVSSDPAVGAILKFVIVDQVESVDVPGVIHHATDPDKSLVPLVLTEQIPLVQPVRERVVEFGHGPGDSVSSTGTGQCIPDCYEGNGFPWTIKINGQAAHSMNANRVGLLIPKPGEVEHWTYVNAGGGWDHPIHLHFEEGITMNRGNKPIDATEKLVRKDVWRLGPAGQVQFQIQFGEYGGSYVNHCHNTVHEDFALLMRIQLLNGGADGNAPQGQITPTPNPTPDGVFYTTPESLREGDPRNGTIGVAPGTAASGGGSGGSGSGSSGSGSSGKGKA
jgi:FtsP/CotA-like multicopper oxidase with cupredoxin domain